MPFLFENLEVYKKALAFNEEIGNITESFKKGNYYLVDQLNRASLSISTNLAEGNGRYHKADRKNFFRISRGSAFECIPILELCKRKGLIREDQAGVLKENLDEICKMLSGLINY
ncbi:MAG: four helix bundle protein [Elusimicrobia bacterium RIFOXYD2_FULL_34_15]|nr:MAG: four helix bundle protein [Elusimicrobia bacterium RIFOXYD2_FULL_34_15]